MTAEEVKRELIKVRVSQQRYKLSSDTARQYKEMISYPGSISYESDGSFKSSKDNSSEAKLMKLLAYEEERDQYAKEMLQSRERAECMISLLTLISEKEVITRRYLMGESWEVIADNMSYSNRSVHYIHKQALKKISETLH